MSSAGIGVVIAGAAGLLAGCSTEQATPATNAPTSLSQGEATATTIPQEVADAPAPSTDSAGADAPVAAVAAPAATRATSNADRAAPQRSATPASASRTPIAVPAGDLYAKVVSSQPIIETERVAREECHDEQVTRQKPVKDEKRVAGAALGAVLGGVLGHQVGDGDGRKLATVAGAVAGGYAGSKVQQRIQDGNTEVVTEKVCKTVYDSREKRTGYTVTYTVGGQMHTARMDRDPGVGASLPMRNGQPVLSSTAAAPARALRSAS
jgi:uncharacterized protein YcfJ